MIAAAAVLLQAFGCLGFGAVALKLLKIDDDLRPGELWALSFATGFGILGWLIFPLGISGNLTPGMLAGVLTLGAFAAALLRRKDQTFSFSRPDGIGWGLLTLLAVVAIFNLAEGIAPPADADTLAYHFAVPKEFIAAGKIHFILQPLNGAIPFLANMTYVPVLALGGEMAVTLWVMLSGWSAAGFLFVLCRRHLGFNWSLAVTLVFMTTPAVVYGAGSGQVETRIALFAMLSAWSIAKAMETGRVQYAVLAGLGAGFFAAAKYTGLLFAAVSGIAVLLQRRWFRHGFAFGLTMLAAGFQWYLWNAVHTGDPVFPILFQWLGRDDLVLWPKAHDLVFKTQYFNAENPLPKSILWLVLFPFKATLNFHGLPDSGRVGFGPYGLLVMPFALIGCWRLRDRVRKSPLLVYAGIAGIFYVVWFFGGGSLRVRHLLPVLPLFLLCMTVAAQRLTVKGPFRLPLLAAVLATLLIQTAGHGVFALNYLKYLARGETRETFLTRNVSGFPGVPWINANLKKTNKVYIHHRQLRFYLDVPSLYGSPLQASINLDPKTTDAQTLHRQLRQAGITHFLLPIWQDAKAAKAQPGYPAPLNILNRKGCLLRLNRIESRRVYSRTLSRLASHRQFLDVLKLKDDSCLRYAVFTPGQLPMAAKSSRNGACHLKPFPS